MAAACVLLSLLSACLLFVHVDSQNCREGWHFHEGSCYSFGESLVTWGDAQTICETFNGYLAEIETSEENEFLRNLTRAKKGHTNHHEHAQRKMIIVDYSRFNVSPRSDHKATRIKSIACAHQYYNHTVLNTFLGGTDIFDEGVWVWATSGNNIFPFVDWSSGEPSDGGGDEDCLSFRSDEDYHWNDIACNLPAHFICEVKAKDVPVVG